MEKFAQIGNYISRQKELLEIVSQKEALLARFDCTKDNSVDATYTVFSNVELKFTNEETDQFFAPEMLKSDLGQGVDWAKADIYSLAKICLFILSGEIIDKKTDTLLDGCDIDDGMKCVIFGMLSEKPEDRPKLDDLVGIVTEQGKA